MKRRQTSEADAQAVGSAVAATADGSDAEQRGDGMGPPAPEAIARRAYEIYLERGAEPGHDIADWFRAEAELREGRQ